MSVVKIIILGFFTVFLSSCYYSKGCWYVAQSVTCSARPEVDPIQTWQKKDSIGHTNPEQRWRDFQECGLIIANDGMWRFRETHRQTYSCMTQKGYIQFAEHECRTESQTKLNGKCN